MQKKQKTDWISSFDSSLILNVMPWNADNKPITHKSYKSAKDFYTKELTPLTLKVKLFFSFLFFGVTTAHKDGMATAKNHFSI